MALPILTTVFRQAYLQKNFGTTLLCMLVAVFAYELLVFAMGLFLGQTIPARFGGFCIKAALTLAAVPVLYPICVAIESLGGESWRE